MSNYETTHVRLRLDTLAEVEELKQLHRLSSIDATIKFLLTSYKNDAFITGIIGKDGNSGKISLIDYLKKEREIGIWATKILESEHTCKEIAHISIESESVSGDDETQNSDKVAVIE